jgi:hypothetical protein
MRHNLGSGQGILKSCLELDSGEGENGILGGGTKLGCRGSDE